MPKNKNFIIRKFFLYFGLQIYGLHQAQTLTHLIKLYGAFKKTKQMQLPI